MSSKRLSNMILDSQPAAVKRMLRLFLLSLLIVLLGVSLAVLSQAQQAAQQSRASDVSVLGSPSLAATTVDSIFRSLGSPMAGNGALIVNLSRQYHIDNAFALGVWWTETNDGEAGVGNADRNPGGVKYSPNYPHAYDGYTVYPSFAAGISDWFFIVQQRYIARGLTTVYSIAQPYVGTSSYPYWAAKVITQMYKYRGIAPPPPPTSTPSSTPKKQLHAQLSPKSLPAHQVLALPTRVRNKFLRLFTGEAMLGLQAPQVVRYPLPTSLPIADQAQAVGAPALPASIQMAIVIASLLAALVLALLALAIGRSAALSVSPAGKVQEGQERPQTSTNAMGNSQVFAPHPPSMPGSLPPARTDEAKTEDKPATWAVAAQSAEARPLPRRVVLLPTHGK